MPKQTDRDYLQMAYNALCGTLYNLDRVGDEATSDPIDAIFADLEEIRKKLGPIAAFPTAFESLENDGSPDA